MQVMEKGKLVEVEKLVNYPSFRGTHLLAKGNKTSFIS